MKVIYIAGPYRSATLMGVADNIRRAEHAGLEVSQAGAMPLIPHANTGLVFNGVGSDEFWLAGTLELMRRCDGVFMMPRWRESTGARAEHAEALRLGIPVFDSTDLDGPALKDWLRGERRWSDSPLIRAAKEREARETREREARARERLEEREARERQDARAREEGRELASAYMAQVKKALSPKAEG